MKGHDIDIEILYKKIENNLSETEKIIFEEWISNDDSHKKYFKEIEKLYNSEKEYKIDKVEVNEAWNQINKKIVRFDRFRHIPKRSSIAAALIIILIGISYFMKLYINREIQNPQICYVQKDILLELADGNILNLTKLAKDEQKHPIKNLSIEKNSLTYTKNQNAMNQTIAYNRLYVPRGGNYHIILEDSSEIWLNADTHLKYPETFIGESRNVYLEGEAYFKVSHKNKPFIVHTGIQKITVLGTEFCIKNYSDEDIETTTLVKGNVKVEFPKIKKEAYLLKPGHQIKYSRKKNKITKEMVDTWNYTAWKDGKYVFTKQRLEDMLNTLARWYDFEVFYLNDHCKNIILSGEIQKFDDFNSILNLLKQSSTIDFRVHGKVVEVISK